MEITTLKNRADFLFAANSGFKFVKSSIIIQSRKRDGMDEIRIGFTATKKLGNAVIRNRAKRRMRAAAARLLPEYGLPGCDYVLIGREKTYKGTYTDLLNDIRHSLKRLKEQMNKESP